MPKSREQRELQAMRLRAHGQLEQSVAALEQVGGAVIRRHRLLAFGSTALLGGAAGFVLASRTGRRRAMLRRLLVVSRSFAITGITRLLRDRQ